MCSGLFLQLLIFLVFFSAFKQRLLSQYADHRGTNVPRMDSLSFFFFGFVESSANLVCSHSLISDPFLTFHTCFFLSKDALVTAINDDIEEAKVKLDHPEHLKFKEDNFFTSLSSAPPSTTSTVSQTIMNGH